MRHCAAVGDYLRAGRIIRNGQYFVFPDHSRIYRSGNETIKQSVDARYASNVVPTPATGSNSIPLNPPRRDAAPQTLTDPVTSAFISESYFLQCTPVVENHAVVVTVEEEDDDEGRKVLAITRSKAKATAATNNDQPLSPACSLPPIPKDVAPKAPAFKYESKATSPDAAKRVYENILNIPVPHLTISDLLSISPDLRKEAIEHSRTQRVPVLPTTTSANALASASSPPLQIEHATPLRELRSYGKTCGRRQRHQ
ncbi:hypothetical protein P692DRAFT_20859587 [Suillus brevipes Sb2]|nr:hypothetical protein P692DRAFT_20859587 [Suillus brevipes Sb2]